MSGEGIVARWLRSQSCIKKGLLALLGLFDMRGNYDTMIPQEARVHTLEPADCTSMRVALFWGTSLWPCERYIAMRKSNLFAHNDIHCAKV